MRRSRLVPLPCCTWPRYIFVFPQERRYHAWPHSRLPTRQRGPRPRHRLRHPRLEPLLQARLHDRRRADQDRRRGDPGGYLRAGRQRRRLQALHQSLPDGYQEVLRLRPGGLPCQGEGGAHHQRHALRRLHHQASLVLPQGEDPPADHGPPDSRLPPGVRPKGDAPGGVRRDGRQDAEVQRPVDQDAAGVRALVQGAGEGPGG
jgi:hypothetical protein